jgi:hypothetical protein
MKYRPHIMGATLDEALEQMVELPDRAALIAHLAADFKRVCYEVDDTDIQVKLYAWDDRIGWNTHIVLLRNKEVAPGVWFFGAGSAPDYWGGIGFTDGPC